MDIIVSLVTFDSSDLLFQMAEILGPVNYNYSKVPANSEGVYIYMSLSQLQIQSMCDCSLASPSSLSTRYLKYIIKGNLDSPAQ